MTATEKLSHGDLQTGILTYTPESSPYAPIRNVTDAAPLSELIGVAVAVCGAVGVLANLAVILVLMLSRSCKQFSCYRYLIVHLAACDLISSVFQLVYAPLELHRHHWIYADWSCKLIFPMMTGSTNLATGTILVIAAERYQGVFWPHHSRWKERTVAIALGVVWLISFFICIPNWIQLIIQKAPSTNNKYCVEQWENRKTLQKVYGISFFFVAFFIPLVAIGFMHTRIICKIRNPDLRPDHVSRSHRRDEVRIATVLTAITVTFAVCVSPNKLLYFAYDVAPSAWSADVLFYMRLVQLPYYARAMVDPLLYCALDKRFKLDVSNAVKAVRAASFIDSLDLRTRTQTGNGRNSCSMHSSPRSSPRTLRTLTRSSSKASTSRDITMDSRHDVANGRDDNMRMRSASEDMILAAARNRWERSVSWSPLDERRPQSPMVQDTSAEKSLTRRTKMYSTSDLPDSPSHETSSSRWTLIRAPMYCAGSYADYDDDAFRRDRDSDDGEKQSFCADHLAAANTTEIELAVQRDR